MRRRAHDYRPERTTDDRDAHRQQPDAAALQPGPTLTEHKRMIMAAAKLVENNPNISEAEIRHGLEGNMCRCTGYQNIVNAVAQAAAAGKGG